MRSYRLSLVVITLMILGCDDTGSSSQGDVTSGRDIATSGPEPIPVERVGDFATGDASLRIQITARRTDDGTVVDGLHGVELTSPAGITRVDARLSDGTVIPFVSDNTGMDSDFQNGDLPVDGTYIFDIIEAGAGNELRNLTITPTDWMTPHTIEVEPTLTVGQEVTVRWTPSGELGVNAQVELSDQDFDTGFGDDDGVEVIPGSAITTPTSSESVQVERRVLVPLEDHVGFVQIDFEFYVNDVVVQ